MQINILEYFTRTTEKNKQRIAIIDQQRSCTFDELDSKSTALCSIICNMTNAVIRKPMAVFMPKCIECVTSDIAIIKSGNAYMNLDVKTPDTRIGAILDIIQPELVITNNAYISRISQMWNADKLINVDELPVLEDTAILQTGIDEVIDADPLCIINTSGSTGVPKGVILNHRSFIDFTEWSLNTMDFHNHEILGCLSPVIFDIYSYELCLMMAKGATMMLIQESLAAFPAKILQMMNEHKVSFIFWVPTIMTNIANMGLLDRVPLPDLHIVWFAGEVFQTKQFNIWRRALPNTTFVNLYGPIEITLDCTYYIADRELSDDEPIPIGRACRNTDILILTDDNRIAGAGEDGELCVRGTSLAMGYYNNSEKTAAAFVQNPLNHSYPEMIYRTGDVAMINERGEIMFKGRKDTLVKHSGYRIELTEIEHVIVNTLGIVKNGCVIYNHDKKEIVLYYEADEEIAVSEMRKRIGTALPNYMIPTKYIKVDEMPRNPNGKIDRLKLKELTAK